MACTASPRPRVTIARLTPRVRIAGSANANPNGTVPRIPINAASSKGNSGHGDEAGGDERAHACQRPLPERDRPQKPVTSTIESRTMPKINDVVIASTHFCDSTKRSAVVAAVSPTITPGRSRPVPSAGRRSNTYPRIGAPCH